jgi:lipoyl(octanoyl) transferase
VKKIGFLDLGLCGYGKALDIQHHILGKVQRGEMGDTLIFVQHPHVLTMGRRAREENIFVDREILKQKNIDVFDINRGGDVTYHGYGQLVGYPIFDLNRFGRDIKKFVYDIEYSIIDDLKVNHDIQAGVNEGKYTGVWIGDKKICAIGIGVKKWVSYHGFAYNINTDLGYFGYINPCGLGDNTVTSLKEQKGIEIDFEKEKQHVLESFCDRFGVYCAPVTCIDKGGGYEIVE